MNKNIIFFALLLVLLGVGKACLAQKSEQNELKISMDIQNEFLEKVLVSLSEKYSIKLVYSNSDIEGVKVSGIFNEATIDQCFTELLSGTGFTYKYTLNINTLIIKKVKAKVKKDSKYTISGFVENSESLERLIGATVFETESFIGTTCNNFGFYSLSLPEGLHKISFSFVGYNAKEIEIDLKKDVSINVQLSEGQLIEEVVVTAKQGREMHNVSQMSMSKLSMKDVKVLPVLMGEQDLIKAIQLIPGVQSGSEGSSGLYVRGGGPDQNLILLDGVPVYNSSHLFGFFSVFNADAINDTKVYKGGFPARFGGRLSSVIDVHMKEGNMKKYHGALSLGLISSKLSIEGPIIKDKTSFIVSGRRTYADLLSKLFSKNSTSLYFYDLNVKVNHKFSDKDRLYASFYGGQDKIENTSDINSMGDVLPSINNMKIGWGNSIAALRWNHIFTPKLFSNTTITYSKFDYNVENKLEEAKTEEKQESNMRYVASYLTKFQSGIEDWSGKIDFDWIPSNSHYVKMGFGGVLHTFTPSANIYDIKNPESLGLETARYKENVSEFFGYAEDDISIGRFAKMNLGVHYSTFITESKAYQSLQPRVSINIKPTERTAIKISYASMSQYLHLLSNSNVGIPIDIWVPSTDIVKPEISTQYAIGFNHEIGKISYCVEAYYKDMENLIEYKDNESIFGKGSKWDENIVTGIGNSYGVEFFIEKKVGNTTGWIGYTLSKTNRTFDELNNGKEFPFKYDRRHDISVVLMHKFNEKFDVGATWIFGSGYAYSIATTKFLKQDLITENNNQFSPNYISDNSERNNMRIPDYHRLDVSVNYHFKSRKLNSTLSLSVYNVYNRMNPFAYQTDVKEGKLRQISLFPIIPTISYKVEF